MKTILLLRYRNQDDEEILLLQQQLQNKPKKQRIKDQKDLKTKFDIAGKILTSKVKSTLYEYIPGKVHQGGVFN